MPRNKTLTELWPSSKDPSYRCSKGRQKLEEEVGRSDGYNLRTRKVIDYKEKNESDVEEEEAPKDSIATKDVDANAVEVNKNNPDVICPVCWSSLLVGGVEVLALGCGHLVCGKCGEEVVLGGRGCSVCRDREGVSRVRRVFF